MYTFKHLRVTLNSRQDIVCLNGFVQVINSVLSIPQQIINLVAQAHMSYLIAILNKANVSPLLLFILICVKCL